MNILYRHIIKLGYELRYTFNLANGTDQAKQIMGIAGEGLDKKIIKDVKIICLEKLIDKTEKKKISQRVYSNRYLVFTKN